MPNPTSGTGSILASLARSKRANLATGLQLGITPATAAPTSGSATGNSAPAQTTQQPAQPATLAPTVEEQMFSTAEQFLKSISGSAGRRRR